LFCKKKENNSLPKGEDKDDEVTYYILQTHFIHKKNFQKSLSKNFMNFNYPFDKKEFLINESAFTGLTNS